MSFRAKAIPTVYNDVQFRSRLEARWAAFFDIVGWGWDYEPFDLDGYIPDFVLKFYKPLIVEVKPIYKWPCLVADCRDPHCRHDWELAADIKKIRSSGWDGEAIIVGSAWWHGDAGSPLLGKFVQSDIFPDDAVGFVCNQCNQASIHAGYGLFECRFAGCGDGDHHIGDEIDPSLWRMAGNRVQWKAPK